MTSDAELVAAIRGGRTEAWGEVYDRHLDRVFGVCFTVLRNRADAEDAAQTAFLKAVERLDQLRDPDATGAWLCGIARRVAIDRIRAARETPVDDWPGVGPIIEPDPTSGLRRAEALELVVEALDGLEARDRLALVLADLGECDGDTLAESLGVGRDNAYVLVKRARERFARSVSVLVVGRTGRRDCPELAQLMGAGGGPMDPRLRKRVARHIDGCEQCGKTRDRHVSPAALLSLIPPVVAPAALRADPASALVPAPRPSDPVRARPHRAGVTKRFLAGGAAVAAVGVAAGTLLVLGRHDRARESQGARVATAVTVAPVPPSVSSAVGTSTSAATAAAGFCDVAEEWMAGYTPGPASQAPSDVEEWFSRNLAFVERLADTAPGASAAGWESYGVAYARLVEQLGRAGWDVNAVGGDDPEMSSLREELETDLVSRCSVGPGE